MEIPGHGKNVELGVNVIMSNHVHGILILNGNIDPHAFAGNTPPGTPVETRHALSLHRRDDDNNAPATRKPTYRSVPFSTSRKEYDIVNRKSAVSKLGRL